MAAVANACRFVFWTKLAAKSLRFLATNQRGTKAGFPPIFETPSWHSVRNIQRHTSLMWNLRGAIDAPRPERRAPTPESEGKNPAAVALGRMGGKARAAALGKRKRAEIARKAAKARWTD